MVGLGIVNLIQPGKIVSKEAQTKLVEAYAEEVEKAVIIANEQNVLLDLSTNLLLILFNSIYF